jgi:hypothetical protein
MGQIPGGRSRNAARPTLPRSAGKDGAPVRSFVAAGAEDLGPNPASRWLDHDVDHQARPGMFRIDQKILTVDVVHVYIV